MAEVNATRLGLAERAAFQTGRWCDGVSGPFDIIVSNPPYIPTSEIAGLDPDVRDYDPALALDGGGDGLDAYRDILAGLPPMPSPGFVLFEVGQGQADAVAILLQSRSTQRPRRWRDLGGIERVVGAAT